MYFFVIKFFHEKEEPFRFALYPRSGFVALLGSTGSNLFEEISIIPAHHFTRYIAQNAPARPSAT